MKLNLKNLGTIKSGCFNANDLTIIFGKNNSGKTYISYVSYILLKKFTDIIYKVFVNSDIFKKLEDMPAFEINIEHFFENKYLKNLNNEIKDALSSGFRAPIGFFEDTEVTFDIDEIKEKAIEKAIDKQLEMSGLSKVGFIKKQKNSTTLLINIVSNENIEGNNQGLDKEMADALTHWFFNNIKRDVLLQLFDFEIGDPFIITSERTGIEQFYKDLDSNRSSLMEEIAFISSNNKSSGTRIRTRNPISWELEDKISTYSLPIADNIKYVRDASRGSRIRFETTKSNFLRETFQKMTQGTFRRSKQGTLFVIADEQNNEIETIIPLQVASSSIKALSLFEIYLNNFFEKGQVLIIDEPELNLHPDNQIHMAELIVRLVNSGVKIIMTTHSDYIVREINNRIKLFKLRESKELKEFVSNQLDTISPKRVNIFNITENHIIEKIRVTNEGIESVIFDEIIVSMSEREDLIDESIYKFGKDV